MNNFYQELFSGKTPKQQHAEFIKKHGFKARAAIKNYYYKTYFANANRKPLRVNELKKGHLYVFKYSPLYKDALDFYDTNPLSLIYNSWYCENTGNYLYTGINLHFLPEKVRLEILDTYWRTYYNKMFGFKRKLFGDSFDYHQYFTLIFSTISSLNFEFAIRRYIVNRVANPVQAKDMDWGKLALVEPELVYGKNLSEIYSLYYKNHK